MPIPKATKDKLEAWKAGAGEFPEELDAGVFFENEAAFMFQADRRLKPKLTEAEKKAANSAKEGREAALAEILQGLGVKDPDELSDIKARLAAADGTATELETLKANLSKTERESKKETERLSKENAVLLGFKTTVLKDKAIAPHLAKIHPDMRDVISENLHGKLVIDGDKITLPEGKAIDAFVDELITAKPSLKAPDYKGGAGTKPGGKAEGEGKDKGKGGAGEGQGDQTPPKFKGTREELAAELSASFKQQTADAGASGQ